MKDFFGTFLRIIGAVAAGLIIIPALAIGAAIVFGNGFVWLLAGSAVFLGFALYRPIQKPFIHDRVVVGILLLGLLPAYFLASRVMSSIELRDLRESDPAAYLVQMKERISDADWLQMLKGMDAEAYEQEVEERRLAAIEQSRREEAQRLAAAEEAEKLKAAAVEEAERRQVAAEERAREAIERERCSIGHAATAFDKAQSLIRDSGLLKAPATARFASHGDSRINMTGCGMWFVLTSVEAQNSFGAFVRMPFYVQLEYLGNDRWRLIDIKID